MEFENPKQFYQSPNFLILAPSFQPSQVQFVPPPPRKYQIPSWWFRNLNQRNLSNSNSKKVFVSVLRHIFLKIWYPQPLKRYENWYIFGYFFYRLSNWIFWKSMTFSTHFLHIEYFFSKNFLQFHKKKIQKMLINFNPIWILTSMTPFWNLLLLRLFLHIKCFFFNFLQLHTKKFKLIITKSEFFSMKSQNSMTFLRPKISNVFFSKNCLQFLNKIVN